MQLYRICPEQFLEDYRGRGASFQGGARWNKAGLPALYFAASASVAMLEMAHYLPSPRLVPPSYRLGTYEIGSGAAIDQWPVEELPDDWNSFPYPASTQVLGSSWLVAAQSAFLIIPSAAVPGGLENIVLVNPDHAEARTITLVAAEARIYNERAFDG